MTTGLVNPPTRRPGPRLHAVPAPIEVRPATPADGEALVALLDRCSDETLFRRFHAPVGPAAHREVRRITRSTPTYGSWVAVAEGAIRGTATLAWGADGLPEAAFLVEDAWFRRGVGRALFGAVGARARARGESIVVARIQADNGKVRRFLEALAPAATSTFEGGGDVRVDIPVAARPALAHLARHAS